MTGEIKAGLPPLPERFLKLPVDERGYPVPWFVGFVDGVPDFRAIRPDGVAIAIRRNLCWLCGEPLGTHKVFVIGPMCAITRTTSEPPSHLDCAEFALKACPFLTNPAMRRSPRAMPEGVSDPAGFHIDRNPGVSCLWGARDFKTFRADGRDGENAGVLITVGEPERVEWWAQGREATRDEVLASIDSGYPLLQATARKDRYPDRSLRDLQRMRERAERFLPSPT